MSELAASSSAESFTVVGEVSPNDVERHSYEFSGPASIGTIRINTFVGQRAKLRYKVFVRTQGIRNTLYKPFKDDYLAGNGEEIVLPTHFHVEEDDELVVVVENVDDEPLTAHAIIPVDQG